MHYDDINQPTSKHHTLCNNSLFSLCLPVLKLCCIWLKSKPMSSCATSELRQTTKLLVKFAKKYGNRLMLLAALSHRSMKIQSFYWCISISKHNEMYYKWMKVDWEANNKLTTSLYWISVWIDLTQYMHWNFSMIMRRDLKLTVEE